MQREPYTLSLRGEDGLEMKYVVRLSGTTEDHKQEEYVLKNRVVMLHRDLRHRLGTLPTPDEWRAERNRKLNAG